MTCIRYYELCKANVLNADSIQDIKNCKLECFRLEYCISRVEHTIMMYRESSINYTAYNNLGTCAEKLAPATAA